MNVDFDCTCGNPKCLGTVILRKGYVNIRHEDGTEEVRWDYLYINAYQGESNERQMVEVMLPPEDARYLMWRLIISYMPILKRLVRFFWWSRCVLVYDLWGR
jgi:hypothetical protein